MKTIVVSVIRKMQLLRRENHFSLAGKVKR